MAEDIYIGMTVFVPHPWRHREYEKFKVKGETSRSWVVGHDNYDHSDIKVPKKDPWSQGKMFSEETMKDREWEDNHRYRIGAAIQQRYGSGANVTTDMLREIAKIIGYNEKEKKE